MSQVLVEIRECALCFHVVVYFGGRFQHLTDRCPQSYEIPDHPEVPQP